MLADVSDTRIHARSVFEVTSLKRSAGIWITNTQECDSADHSRFVTLVALV